MSLNLSSQSTLILNQLESLTNLSHQPILVINQLESSTILSHRPTWVIDQLESSSNLSRQSTSVTNQLLVINQLKTLIKLKYNKVETTFVLVVLTIKIIFGNWLLHCLTFWGHHIMVSDCLCQIQVTNCSSKLSSQVRWLFGQWYTIWSPNSLRL